MVGLPEILGAFAETAGHEQADIKPDRLDPCCASGTLELIPLGGHHPLIQSDNANGVDPAELTDAAIATRDNLPSVPGSPF